MRTIRIHNLIAMAASLALLAGTPAFCAADEGPKVALASHSFHELNLSRLLPRAARMGVRYMELSDRHVSVFSSERDIERLRAAFAQTGIKPASTFTAFLSADEASNRQIFEFARSLEMEFIAAVPDPELLPMLSELAEEYGVGVALHNGEAEEPYGTLEKVKAVLEQYPGIDTVVDVGYYARQGADPVEVVHALAGRIREIHAKDMYNLDLPEKDEPYTVVGFGLVDWPAIADALRDTGFTGYVTVEYTGDFWNYLTREPKISQSLGYLNGLFE